MRVSSSASSDLIGRTIALLHLLAVPSVIVVFWGGVLYVPVAVTIAAVLMIWPKNGPALLVAAALAGFLALVGWVTGVNDFGKPEWAELVPAELWLAVVASIATLSLIALWRRFHKQVA